MRVIVFLSSGSLLWIRCSRRRLLSLILLWVSSLDYFFNACIGSVSVLVDRSTSFVYLVTTALNSTLFPSLLSITIRSIVTTKGTRCSWSMRYQSDKLIEVCCKRIEVTNYVYILCLSIHNIQFVVWRAAVRPARLH